MYNKIKVALIVIKIDCTITYVKMYNKIKVALIVIKTCFLLGITLNYITK